MKKILIGILLLFVGVLFGCTATETTRSLSDFLARFDEAAYQAGTLEASTEVALEMVDGTGTIRWSEKRFLRIGYDSASNNYYSFRFPDGSEFGEGKNPTPESGFMYEVVSGYFCVRIVEDGHVETNLATAESILDILDRDTFSLEKLAPFPSEAEIVQTENRFVADFTVEDFWKISWYRTLFDFEGLGEELALRQDDPVALAFDFGASLSEAHVGLSLSWEYPGSDYTVNLRMDMDVQISGPDFALDLSLCEGLVFFAAPNWEVEDVRDFDLASDVDRRNVFADYDVRGWIGYRLDPGFYRFTNAADGSCFRDARIRFPDGSVHTEKLVVATESGVYSLGFFGLEDPETLILGLKFPEADVGTPLDPIYTEETALSGTLTDSRKFFMFEPSEDDRYIFIYIRSASGDVSLLLTESSPLLRSGLTFSEKIPAGLPGIIGFSGSGNYDVAISFANLGPPPSY